MRDNTHDMMRTICSNNMFCRSLYTMRKRIRKNGNMYILRNKNILEWQTVPIHYLHYNLGLTNSTHQSPTGIFSHRTLWWLVIRYSFFVLLPRFFWREPSANTAHFTPNKPTISSPLLCRDVNCLARPVLLTSGRFIALPFIISL